MRTEVIFTGAFQILLLTSAVAPAAALAQEADQTKAAQTQTDKAQVSQKQTEVAQKNADENDKATSVPGGSALGMSILGNHEAPTALVLVPWRSSEPGKGPEISTKVDDSRNPIDKEVFIRMLHYQQIAKTNAAPPDTAAASRRK